MPLFKRGPNAPTAGSKDPEPEIRSSTALPAIVDQLNDELWRAQRYGRPLSVAVAAPDLLEGESIGPDLAAAVQETARHTLRRSDGVEVIDRSLLVAILPETDHGEAQAAAFRLGTALTLPGFASRQVKWRAFAVTLDLQHSGQELLDTALKLLNDSD